MENLSKNPAVSTRQKVVPTLENHFKNNLKWFRKNNNLSQQDLANATGLSRASLAAYEEGRGTPNYTDLIILSDYFGIRVDELIREAKPVLCLDDEHFNYFAKCHITLNRFISRSDLYALYLEIAPKTTAQAFKAKVENWAKEKGYTFNPKEFIEKTGRIIIRHEKRVAEFFFIRSAESEVKND